MTRILCAALCTVMLAHAGQNKDRKYTMPEYTVIEQNNGRVFMPYTVTAKEPIKTIFPVPVKDAVGTIDIGNAITIIHFHGGTAPDYQSVAKDFLNEVNGDYDFRFCPIFSDEQIAYTQTRWAVIADIKSRKVITPVLTMSLDEMIGGMRLLDKTTNRFIVNRLTPAHEGSHQMLTVMQLNGNAFCREGEIPGGIDRPGYEQPWIVHDGKIITYDHTTNKLLCHDAGLHTSTHPFVDIFNRNNSKFRKLKEMVIHPTLPFGLVIEIGKDIDKKELRKFSDNNQASSAFVDKWAKQAAIHALYLIRWDVADTAKQFIPLHSDAASLLPPLKVREYRRFTFSPEGKWLVFGHEDMHQDKNGNFIGGEFNPFFVGIPVDVKNPLFLGEPVFLGRTLHPDHEFTTSAWASEPTAFIAADGMAMYKWDLGNLYSAKKVCTPDVMFPLK